MVRPSRAGPGRIVTLASDVGSTYAAQMKAVMISGGVPPGHIVDLAHDLPAHGVEEAAFLLREIARGFPSSVVHVAVVDPGVGGHRAPIVIETKNGAALIGPDNGVLFPLAEELGVLAAYRIDPGKLLLKPPVGTTFEGRDVFAPAAALLATGVRPSALGPRIVPTRYSIPEAKRTRRGARGEVLHIDRFGNLISNVPSRWIGRGVREVVLTSGAVRARAVRWATSYESLGTGALGALGSSFGLVEIAVGEGRAADLLKVRVGSPIAFAWSAGIRATGEMANSARPRNRR